MRYYDDKKALNIFMVWNNLTKQIISKETDLLQKTLKKNLDPCNQSEELIDESMAI